MVVREFVPFQYIITMGYDDMETSCGKRLSFQMIERTRSNHPHTHTPSSYFSPACTAMSQSCYPSNFTVTPSKAYCHCFRFSPKGLAIRTGASRLSDTISIQVDINQEDYIPMLASSAGESEIETEIRECAKKKRIEQWKRERKKERKKERERDGRKQDGNKKTQRNSILYIKP